MTAVAPVEDVSKRVQEAPSCTQALLSSIRTLDRRLNSLGIGGNSLLFNPLNAYTIGVAERVAQEVPPLLTDFEGATKTELLGMGRALGQKCQRVVTFLNALSEAASNNLKLLGALD